MQHFSHEAQPVQPVPLAGGVWQPREGAYVVQCPACGKRGREYPNRRQAVAAWNFGA